MKTLVIKLGIRSSSVGFATLQTKSDIIAAAVERDRFVRSLESPRARSGHRHDQLISLLREAG